MKGFTLIELVVSVGIIITLTGVLLINYPDATIRLNLVNTSHYIALLFREAQVRGSAVDSANGSIAGYGVYTNLTTPTKLVLFGDLVTLETKNGVYIGDKTYTTSPTDEMKSITTLPSRFQIGKLCVGTSYPFSCNENNTPPITSLTVTFVRPNPEPYIYINNATSTSYTGACVELWSPKHAQAGHVRSVRVLGAGLITTSTDACE
jgi:type II secretory pathway pseudopilin PulG